MAKPTDLVHGTLDLLILKTLALQPMHGWGIAQRIRQVSKEVLQVIKAHFIPRCIVSSNRAGFTQNGANRQTIAALSFIHSPPTALSICAGANAMEATSSAIGLVLEHHQGAGTMRWFANCHFACGRFRKDRAELDLSEELQFHLQNQIDEYVARGMNPKEARHAALRSLGGIEQAKEECRDARQAN